MNRSCSQGRHRPPVRVGSAASGQAAGAILFACVLAAIAVGGWLWLTDREARLEAGAVHGATPQPGRADKWTSQLGRFLEQGPEPGSWQTRSLSCLYTHYLAPHPRKPDVVLIAQVGPEGSAPPRAVSRWLVPRFFFRAPAHLFFSNYVRTEGPISEEIDDGTRCWRVHWGPRDQVEGLTERIVWFAQVGGEVVQVEDRARNGQVIRSVRRLARDTGSWDPAEFDPATLEHIESEPPDPSVDPERTLADLATKASFDVYAPRYLPPGFVLVRSTFDVRDAATMPASANPASPERATAPVQLLSQLYSDGLGLISVGVALTRDMDAIESLTDGMTELNSPTPCPGLPAEPRDVRHEGATVRMRTDSCRTVLRRDDLTGVSVTIIGRNEIGPDEYLRMMASLQRLARGDGGARKSGGDRKGTDR
ncbi:MAG: hypothetical protein O2894_00565 [Planctomycetota bacterium]|nr:hypothetical protein [Planctomycetota bacterium]